MKKANSNKRKSLFFLVLFALCLSFFNLSCGLDTITFLEDPFSVNNLPNVESSFETCDFSFSVRKLDNPGETGRAYIYYKIYNDDQKVSSEESSLISKSEDSSGKIYSFSYMRDTYGYKQLCYIKEGDTSFTTFDLLNDKFHNVKIRLTNYFDIEEYSASISVDGEKVGVPVRMTGKTFDFGRKGENDQNPMVSHSTENASSGDTKGFLEKQDEGEENIFYVSMFGVFEQPDDNWDFNQSSIHFLGRVKIDANDLNN